MILLATSNSHKIAKLREIIDGLDEPVTLAEAGLVDNFKERGRSLKEIAENKAVFYSKAFHGRAIATDAGARIPALKGWRPERTKRFAGEPASDFERMDALLKQMTKLKGRERRFEWVECAAIAENGRLLFSTEARGDEGILQETYDKRKYKKGIWLGSLWNYPRLRKNFFDLTPRQREQHAETSWRKIRNSVRRFLRKRNEQQTIRPVR